MSLSGRKKRREVNLYSYYDHAGIVRHLEELARQGWAVCINYRVREDCARSLLEQLTAEGCRAMMVRADVSQRDQVEAMVRRVEDTFGPVSLLVNNAGVAGPISGHHR